MNSPAVQAAPAQPRKQAVSLRFLLFLIGGVVNYLLISLPLKYFKHHHPDWPDLASTGLSVAAGTTFFFFWNYFVNFRTSATKRNALTRYLVAAGVLWALQWMTLWVLTHVDKNPLVAIDLHPLFRLPLFHINRDVVGAQVLLGGFKFLIYNYWAFPAHKEE